MINIDPQFDAFRFHDEMGLPLTVVLHAALEAGSPMNLATFACDALRAGWSEDKLRLTLEEACADNNIAFNWHEFKNRLAILWTITGRKREPECWPHMKEYIADATRHSQSRLCK